jgi:hypothetical protein
VEGYSNMTQGCPEYQTACRFSRRRLLQAGSAGILGLSLPSLLKAADSSSFEARAKHIILLHQFGGPVACGYLRHEARCALGYSR